MVDEILGEFDIFNIILSSIRSIRFRMKEEKKVKRVKQDKFNNIVTVALFQSEIGNYRRKLLGQGPRP